MFNHTTLSRIIGVSSLDEKHVKDSLSLSSVVKSTCTFDYYRLSRCTVVFLCPQPRQIYEDGMFNHTTLSRINDYDYSNSVFLVAL